MQMIKMRVSGISEINRALKEIGSTAQIKGARAGNLAAARVLQKAAQRTVPIGRTSHTDSRGKVRNPGNLKKSIIVKRWGKFEGKGYFQHIVGPATGRRAKFDGWYGRLVEFGANPHPIVLKKGSRHRGLGKDGKFGRHVEHKGFGGRGWLEKAFNMVCVQALDAFAQSYAKAAFRFGIINPSKGRYVGTTEVFKLGGV